jgi:hypothetical protein
MGYFTQEDLEEAISPQKVIALCDDDDDGAADQAVVNALIRRASGRVDNYIATKYVGPFPITQSPTPESLREAALEFGIGMAFMRHPEYVRTYGERERGGMWTQAEKLCQAIVLNLQRVVGYTAEPEPANVGGEVLTGNDDATDGVGTGTFQGGFGDF